MLPVTRRRAKVSSVHLIRLGALGFAAGPASLLLIGPTTIPDFSQQSAVGGPIAAIPSQVLDLVLLLAILALPILSYAWWFAAISQYLKMPQAWLVAGVVAFVGNFAGGVLVFCLIAHHVIRL